MMGRRANVASVSALNGAIVGRDAAATGRRGGALLSALQLQ
jgi:hypothetical protein